ncbi:hypothetical protein SLEP1_g12332 [Rubroshorea leprosula]|uniref:Uncharacterized protein n=1 Tax=Rubroshorea leprosula TaxID=152421 RepID=A0AAV5INJ0_9ROSI|nr:hypothetical protein SLEP1_g12332 [Rubroshorea leprosula]
MAANLNKFLLFFSNWLFLGEVEWFPLIHCSITISSSGLGCFTEECSPTLICELFGLQWYIIQHQLRLD